MFFTHFLRDPSLSTMVTNSIKILVILLSLSCSPCSFFLMSWTYLKNKVLCLRLCFRWNLKLTITPLFKNYSLRMLCKVLRKQSCYVTVVSFMSVIRNLQDKKRTPTMLIFSTFCSLISFPPVFTTDIRRLSVKQR